MRSGASFLVAGQFRDFVDEVDEVDVVDGMDGAT